MDLLLPLRPQIIATSNSNILSTNSKNYLRKKSFLLLPLLLIIPVPSIPFHNLWSNHLYLAIILAKIVNGSLVTGNVPSPWKRAIIIPKLKKPNLDPIFCNYRPLSNLSYISKLTEKAASIQIVDHPTLHHLFPVKQSA